MILREWQGLAIKVEFKKMLKSNARECLSLTCQGVPGTPPCNLFGKGAMDIEIGWRAWNDLSSIMDLSLLPYDTANIVVEDVGDVRIMSL